MSTPATEVPSGELRKRWGVPRFGYASNRAMLWLGMRALWLGYLGVWFAALYFFLFVPKARRGSKAYLELVYQKRGVVRRNWQAYRHMIEYGYLLMDRALMLAGPRHGFEMAHDGLENLRHALEQDRGVMMLTAHFGNAEAAAPYMAENGLNRRLHIVMYRDAKDGTERFHSEQRKMLAGMDVITTTDPLAAGVKIVRALAAGDAVAMRADRTIGGRTVEATLLGRRVALPAGPFVSAALSGASVVNLYTCRLGWRKYVCVISPPRSYGAETPGTQDERVKRAAEEYAAVLESMLRKHPLQWTNFFDFWGEQRPVKI